MSSEIPLYRRDPQAWRDHLAEGNRTQPRKRVGADVLFRDATGKVLIVEPSYKPYWDLPGGMANANEPPLGAAIREVREELGLSWPGGRLLAVDWVPPHDPWDDSLMFIFDGGILPVEVIDSITRLDGELTSHSFVAPSSAEQMLSERLARRIAAALDALASGQVAYLHDGGQ
ncbi:NUDIX hydrolase [Catellatospora sp. TT07R-123]|uniref:NUDIX domain-containing protein n=1 Tax=Catellatospora sp. TT07R-123 TaxID=2733863 RepID=UPI001B19FE1F|nr:NUDIX hydrolase [Catellatospora sp. TT07R-123]GHJ48988.1 NUDIX hydrolase [Catellatospora sp. TT07R-123]